MGLGRCVRASRCDPEKFPYICCFSEEYIQNKISEMEENMAQPSTSVETLSNANVGAKEPTDEVTNYQGRNETRDASSIPKIEISYQTTRNVNAGNGSGALNAVKAASVSDTDLASATKIASAWRSYRKSREKRGKILSAKSRDELKKVEENEVCLHLPGTCKVWSRWEELLEAVIEQVHRKNTVKGPPSTNQKLELAVSVVERIAKGSLKNHLWLILDTEHWLEICDVKHRYGSNLKVYHDYWLHTETQENFFDWLDEGDGKELDIDGCSREMLESQLVKYLTPEERLDYEVTFKDGLLIYKKSEKPVHTNPAESSNMASLLISEPPITASLLISEPPSPAPSLAGSLSEAKGEQSISNPTHSRNDSETNNVVVREKWIYVTDCDGKFYVGRKIKGHFHHSSFLAGGAICAAGGIKVHEGKLLAINPNSGHYKPTQRHFSVLIERLRQGGVDLDSTEVKVVYPNDILEEHLMGKYKFKRLVDLSIAYGAVMQDAEHVVNRKFDSVDRRVTKTSNFIKKNMKAILREGKESFRAWRSVKTNNRSGLVCPNAQPAVGVRNDGKIKSKHERKFSGFVQEIFMGVVLFFSGSDQVDTQNAKRKTPQP